MEEEKPSTVAAGNSLEPVPRGRYQRSLPDHPWPPDRFTLTRPFTYLVLEVNGKRETGRWKTETSQSCLSVVVSMSSATLVRFSCYP